MDADKSYAWEDNFDDDEEIRACGQEGLVRPYSDTADKLIVLMVNVDGYDAERIAYFLKRDPADVAKHIREMKKNGTFQKYHEEMMVFDGLYRYQMLKKLRKLQKIRKR